jgi:hypothetical protein
MFWYGQPQLPSGFCFSASSTSIHMRIEVSSAPLAVLPNARFILRCMRNVVIHADTVVTTIKPAKINIRSVTTCFPCDQTSPPSGLTEVRLILPQVCGSPNRTSCGACGGCPSLPARLPLHARWPATPCCICSGDFASPSLNSVFPPPNFEFLNTTHTPDFKSLNQSRHASTISH